MGTDEQTEIACDNCGTVYSGHVWVYADSTHFEITDPEEFEFYGDMPMYEPEEFEPADDPHSIASEALTHLGSLVGTRSPQNDPQFTNRLVFAGAVSSLEAFLADTLINAVREDQDVRNRLASKNKPLGELQVSAAKLAADPDALANELVRYLKGLLFHDLKTANALYRDAFGITWYPSKVEADLIFPAMLHRHDCVHRNGRNKEGEKLEIFDNTYVQTFIAAVKKVIDHIEFHDSPF